MLNRSAACQAAVAHPRILAVIEPLLGDDCHVIANTAWRNPPDFTGGPWHCDAGPHVPRPEGVPWDDRIPYPIFAIATHVMLQDCTRADGPTAVVPGSHRSRSDCAVRRATTRPHLRRAPARGDRGEGRRCRAVRLRRVASRRTRGPGGQSGRYFLQVHYGRRDIAQRLRTTDESNQLSHEAVARATTDRERDRHRSARRRSSTTR